MILGKKDKSMKRTLALILASALLLSGCSELIPPRTTMPTETEEIIATEEPTEETTEAPTEPAPVYTNPLTGEVIEAPCENRIFMSTISNVRDALPHYGTMNADILMEMWVNGSIIRDLALFSDPSKASQIGSVRSDRLMFNRIALHYDGIIMDAAGSDTVLGDARNRGVDRMVVDTADTDPEGYSYRDTNREFLMTPASKYEHCLFVNGPRAIEMAESKGISTTQSADKDYFLHFVEDGTPADGETADQIDVTFTYSRNVKKTTMVYNPELNKYVYNQYDKEMYDGATGEPEAFRNVIIMLAQIKMIGMYYDADFPAGGEGYYACGGKMIPITWSADDEFSPFRFFTADGQPLNMGVGNTYIAIAPVGSPVSSN